MCFLHIVIAVTVTVAYLKKGGVRGGEREGGGGGGGWGTFSGAHE